MPAEFKSGFVRRRRPPECREIHVGQQISRPESGHRNLTAQTTRKPNPRNCKSPNAQVVLIDTPVFTGPIQPWAGR